MLGLTPNIIYATSTFYDPSNNPLNVSCEGPRIVPVAIDLSKDTTFVIDFSQLFSSGKITSLQSFLGQYSTPGFQNVKLISDVGYLASLTPNTAFAFPLFCGASPKITITQAATASATLNLSFANYILTPFVSTI